MKILSSFSIFLLLMVSACGPDSSHCSLDGRFLKMNQGEFRVYSPDGSIKDVDTIHVAGGRFEYDMECQSEGIIVIVLPNFYELPVFTAPGKEITLRADASQIKNIEITGTDANEEMTAWRKANADLTPEKQAASAEKYINDNPTSIVSRWLFFKYLVNSKAPDLKKNAKMGKMMLKEIEKEKKNNRDIISTNQSAWITKLTNGLQNVSSAMIGDVIPDFTAEDINGKKVNAFEYRKGLAVITVQTTYNYDSQNINRRIKNYRESDKKDLKVLTISLDASIVEAKQCQRRDSMPWPVVCDQMMWESDIVRKLGFTYIPDNVILKNGKVIARHKNFEDLKKILESN